MTEAAAPNPAWRRFSPAAPARLLSDERLAQRATDGDQRAFEEIYDRYGQGLYRFCLAMVGNPQDAQDALQNTMVKALRALPGEQRRIQLKPWLYRIARNESVELMRRRRESVDIEPDQTQALGEIASTVETRERLRALIDDLEELPERQRAALVMRELAGLGFDQIGNVFDSSAAVARQTVYEARLSLRQMEAGRELSCRDVMRELSDADGRVTRRRELRAHLRSCADCRAFREGISKRHADLAAIAPLPAAASAALLSGVLGTGTAGATAGAAGAGLAGTIGAGAGKAVATSAIVKSAAAVAVVAAVGVGADRSGLIESPLRVGGDGSGGHPAKELRDLPGTKADRRGAVDGTAGAGIGGSGGDAEKNGAGEGPGATEGGRGREGADGRGRQRSARERSKGNAGSGASGHGRAHGKGRPDGLPGASSHGQQTAAAHKAPQARVVPGPGGSPSGNSQAGSKPSPSPPTPAASPPPPKKESTAPAESAPPPEPQATDGESSGGGKSQSGGSPEP
jgi:RNA polymerase sigma factor (sigma-70 family)